MRLWPERKPVLEITTVYACGHTQMDEALRLDGLGLCRACDAIRAVIGQSTGWL